MNLQKQRVQYIAGDKFPQLLSLTVAVQKMLFFQETGKAGDQYMYIERHKADQSVVHLTVHVELLRLCTSLSLHQLRIVQVCLRRA